ncbi:hypothetical protein KP509_14G031800 [Ceratopteris richardii]|uniref:E3 ubiquitin protein ligase n=1 Tax=Ceratopteris richardii TaxID=49495 RepID=A0A8T2T8N9_CERRI|nr:hypothetical protein KP509_14G031800 [Ceratopteris richardii]
MGSTEEPERKRRHLNHSSISPALKKQASFHSSEEKKVDAGMLQYQNQKLEQQLYVHRSEINALEGKCSQLSAKHAFLENSLQTVQCSWARLLENVGSLSLQASNCVRRDGTDDGTSRRDTARRCSSTEEDFFQRLLATGATDSCNENNDTASAEINLKSCRAAALKSVEGIFQAIDTQRACRSDALHKVKEKLGEDDDLQVQQIDDNLLEVESLRSAMDTLQLKHIGISSQLRLWRRNRVRSKADIKVLTGELEETVADLESTRQNIASLRNQKDLASGNGVGVKAEDADKPEGKPFHDAKALECAIEEAKTLASLRSKELDELKKEKGRLTEQHHKIQETFKDERHITTSHLYNILKDQVTALQKELDDYGARSTSSTMDQESPTRGDNVEVLTAEAGGTDEILSTANQQKLSELEAKLQDGISKRSNLSVRLDEMSHALDRQDEVAEFKVMISTLEKEMGMMQQQLDKYREASCRAEVLRMEAESKSFSIESKTMECKAYSEKLINQLSEVKSLREEARILRENEQELKLILDMYGSESTDTRSLTELKEAECSALAEVEKLKSALDDHGLELRVRVANEAEAACQQRLTMAEAEISEFRQRLDACERVVMELKEAAVLKSEEHDSCLAEIETIGQAYEDMQTQNQRLLGQISKRDQYNIKLVSESIKSKQLLSNLQEEKQHLLDFIQQATNFGDTQKQRITRLEQQLNSHLEQLSKYEEDRRQHGRTLAMLKRRLVEANNESLAIKTSLEGSRKAIDHHKGKSKEMLALVEKEKLAKKKVEDEIALLNAKMAKKSLKNEGTSLVEKLQDEVKEYRAILKCSVCDLRHKEVVITKCYHLFCNPCIQKNLEIRHRKCPGCGITFGQSDVRAVHI